MPLLVDLMEGNSVRLRVGCGEIDLDEARSAACPYLLRPLPELAPDVPVLYRAPQRIESIVVGIEGDGSANHISGPGHRAPEPGIIENIALADGASPGFTFRKYAEDIVDALQN